MVITGTVVRTETGYSINEQPVWHGSARDGLENSFAKLVGREVTVDDRGDPMRNGLMDVDLIFDRQQLVQNVGVAVAEHFFEVMQKPDSQGPKFVWPDSLFRMVREMSEVQLFTAFHYEAGPTKEEQRQCGKVADARARALVAVSVTLPRSSAPKF